LMDIHHDTSLRFILEDGLISLASTSHICFCSNKRARLSLVVKPSIRSFHITHSIFISTLCFCLGLIQPLGFNLLTCECGQRLDTFGTDLTCCLFGGQRISTHDAIWNVMYALAWKNGHIVWREQWYAFTSRISLQSDLYITRKGPSLHCQCGGYWPDMGDSGFKCH
jgi:hypothetical protein